MTIREAMNQGMIALKVSKIEQPKQKARLLMQAILHRTRQYILVYEENKLLENQLLEYKKGIEQLKKGIPLQHITHQQEFMKMDFYVNSDVLIPRADTEILVEEVIMIAKKIKAKKILDLCTGSGAIAISLAKYIENSQVTAVDISKKALEVAKRNAKANRVEEQITFLQSDLFEKLKREKYDIIVSNPPYIAKQVILTLEKEVQKEPIIALDGGEDGLDFYRKIIKTSYEFLKYQGYLCLEIGYDQKEAVQSLIKEQENYISTYSKKDLYGNDRIVITKVGD